MTIVRTYSIKRITSVPICKSALNQRLFRLTLMTLPGSSGKSRCERFIATIAEKLATSIRPSRLAEEDCGQRDGNARAATGILQHCQLSTALEIPIT